MHNTILLRRFPMDQWYLEFPGALTMFDKDGNSFTVTQYIDKDANTFTANNQYTDKDGNTFTGT